MNDNRQTGVLLSVTSLPSRFGIGDFGPEAYHFIDLLSEYHIAYWQILPLNPIGYGHSPYQPYSSFAIDEQFINLDELVHKGFLGRVRPFQKDEQAVHYEECREYKLPLLRRAFISRSRRAQIACADSSMIIHGSRIGLFSPCSREPSSLLGMLGQKKPNSIARNALH